MAARIVTTLGMIALGCSVSMSAQRPAEPAVRTVTLTLAEYNRLLDLSAHPPVAEPVVPVGAVLTSAGVRIRVDANIAQGQFTLTGEVLRDGVNRITLLEGSTVTGGTVNGRPLPLVNDANGPAAFLSAAGPFAVTVDWGAPLVLQPGRASFTLPVPPAGTAQATFDIPGEQADVRLSPGLITRRAVADGRTIVEATLQPGAPATVWWTMRDSAPTSASRDVRTVGDVLTLVTIGESEIRMVALVDITVLQGEPRTLVAKLPAGYELTSLSGRSLDTSDARDGTVVLTVGDPSLRRHQFLIGLERPHELGSFALDTAVVTLPGTERERGEIGIEGLGTLELDVADREALHRIDVRELNPAVQSLARTPVLAAFRYQRSANPIAVAMSVKRFLDAGVLAAIADRCVATTMVTSEGRALTEISLRIRNRAQPFLKVALPEGATLASVEVEGEPAKPVMGADGIRVPLLRPGFHPDGPYTVSFVYMHAGTPFEKKGELPMSLPKMDLPIALLEWELFVPDRYSVKPVNGNVIDRGVAYRVSKSATGTAEDSVVTAPPSSVRRTNGQNGEIRGRITDSSGAVLPGVTVELGVSGAFFSALTDGTGTYVLSGVPGGTGRLTASLTGFSTVTTSVYFDGQARQWDPSLHVGSIAETIMVAAAEQGPPRRKAPLEQAAASVNVLSLQRRAAGVLPIRIDVPRAGTSHAFIKPLVVDQSATVTLRYRRR